VFGKPRKRSRLNQLGVLMAIPPTDIRILFTNYDFITYFLNRASCSEHFISITHRILATFNINKKKSILTAGIETKQVEKLFSKSQFINSFLLY
jgi:hypothetical protein